MQYSQLIDNYMCTLGLFELVFLFLLFARLPLLLHSRCCLVLCHWRNNIALIIVIIIIIYRSVRGCLPLLLLLLLFFLHRCLFSFWNGEDCMRYAGSHNVNTKSKNIHKYSIHQIYAMRLRNFLRECTEYLCPCNTTRKKTK